MTGFLREYFLNAHTAKLGPHGHVRKVILNLYRLNQMVANDDNYPHADLVRSLHAAVAPYTREDSMIRELWKILTANWAEMRSDENVADPVGSGSD